MKLIKLIWIQCLYVNTFGCMSNAYALSFHLGACLMLKRHSTSFESVDPCRGCSDSPRNHFSYRIF
jgi:hypothetical protein